MTIGGYLGLLLSVATHTLSSGVSQIELLVLASLNNWVFEVAGQTVCPFLGLLLSSRDLEVCHQRPPIEDVNLFQEPSDGGDD